MQTDLQTLDRITMTLDHLAREFGVSFRHAAQRAIGLNIITQQQWQDLQSVARQESMMNLLTKRP